MTMAYSAGKGKREVDAWGIFRGDRLVLLTPILGKDDIEKIAADLETELRRERQRIREELLAWQKTKPRKETLDNVIARLGLER